MAVNVLDHPAPVEGGDVFGLGFRSGDPTGTMVREAGEPGPNVVLSFQSVLEYIELELTHSSDDGHWAGDGRCEQE